MNVIIPINGIGSRFTNENYVLPKPLINVLGKRMIFWVIDSLKLTTFDTLIIPYSDQLDYHNFRDIVTDQYPTLNIKFIPVDRPTRGAAETLLYAINELGEIDNLPTLVIDCDTFYGDDIVSTFRANPCNCVHYFVDTTTDPIYSYVELSSERYFSKPHVLNIAEKKKISNYASTGAYGFSDIELLHRYCKALMDRNELLTNGEYYVSAIYKLMIDDELDVYGRQVDNFHCVGTPLQLKVFCETYKQDTKRFCFDLDSTLVTKPRIEGDYSTVEPIEKNINFVRYLKNMGHTIIIYTARRMRTHKGNIGAVMADISKLTFNTLDEFEIPYDEVYFGKPWADFYIDDLGVDCNHDIEKATGYYNTMTKPRDFNSINIEKSLITKTGSIEGEAYYYNAIKQYPELVKHFPQLISATKQEIKIERIDGVTFSYLLQNNNLTSSMFHKMLGALDSLHNTYGTHGVDHAKKMREHFNQRFKSYDYSKFGNTDVIDKAKKAISNIYSEPFKYPLSVIHGDPVFSNIIYDCQENIKFIDMRGCIGDTFTIYGDARYDYAKIYQSLSGYDFILNDRRIVKDTNLLNELLQHAEIMYGYSESDIRMMAGCLYLSLIPLHDNDKCFKYFDMAKRLLEC